MMWSNLLRDGCWKNFDRNLVISGVVLNQIDNSMNSLLKFHLQMVQRIPRFGRIESENRVGPWLGPKSVSSVTKNGSC